MPTYKIPLLPDTMDQSMTIELSGQIYKLRVLWNERGQYFSLSLAQVDDAEILNNIKMVKNYPLIARYRSIYAPAGEFVFFQDSGTPRRPLYEDLAKDFNLYYVV